MFKLRQRLDLALEALPRLCRQTADQFQRNLASRVNFVGEEYPTHAALAEQALKAKRSQLLTFQAVGVMSGFRVRR